MSELSIFGISGLPEIATGDHVGELITEHVELREGDVVVVTQKIVSKSEGRIVKVDHDDVDAKSRLALTESVRVLRRRGDLLITETRHGFVCANAGVDFSNIEEGFAALLPVDPDRSARRIRDEILGCIGVRVAVVISDTFGRAWRRGLTDVAIGCAGIGAILDLRGEADALGRVLEVTEVCIADEVAGAAELVMGKSSGIPVAVVRGISPRWLRESSVTAEIVRPPGEDLFR